MRTPGPGEPGETVTSLFDRQARSTPDAVALSVGDLDITYAELSVRVDCLAGALRAHGVGRDTPVALEMDRSPELVVAILGVLKAGGAYVPIDPGYPAERRDYMRADSGALLVLTSEDIDGDAESVQEGPDQDAFAYIIYTSGSTGRPKGVAVEHRALLSRVRWMRERFALVPGDRMYQHASVSFDAHAEEIFPCLTSGATLVLPPKGQDLPDLLAAGVDLTVLDLPTSYWQGLIGVTWPERLRLVILGADPLRGAVLSTWYDSVGPHVELMNTYGPTEATIIATAATLTQAEAAGCPPIGFPLSDTRVYVLDGSLAQVAPGEEGELCIGGIGLAHGYLGKPGLTAHCFVPDPYGPPGSRMYRTGDRTRTREDGALEFVGRLDGQIKVRGFRVEPGEVEIRLFEHPAVSRAVVVARDDALVAYVITAESVPGEELKAHVAAALPGHMVPSTISFLDKMPLTRSGKIDRAALPDPAAGSRRLDLPATPMEEKIAAIWAELLGVEQVGVLDDFFSLGGHSLVATKLAVWLTPLAGRHVSMRVIFTNRTVRSLAAFVEGSQSGVR
ncbi:non-ribosomal peptide synthetase [Streptosporangium sp. NPDC006007]|uniref:non-ribosomal peptide synthetase n=1 Tax=Streptosporangium sp. NPDC006007 TaxID=3154575 RepID=UPI0033A6658B